MLSIGKVTDSFREAQNIVLMLCVQDCKQQKAKQSPHTNAVGSVHQWEQSPHTMLVATTNEKWDQ